MKILRHLITSTSIIDLKKENIRLQNIDYIVYIFNKSTFLFKEGTRNAFITGN